MEIEVEGEVVEVPDDVTDQEINDLFAPDTAPTPELDVRSPGDDLREDALNKSGLKPLSDGVYSDENDNVYEIRSGQILKPGEEPTRELALDGFGKIKQIWNEMPDYEKAAVVASPIPFIGTAAGVNADVQFLADPENQTWVNGALTSMGYVPFGVGTLARIMKAGMKPLDVTKKMERLESPFNGQEFTYRRAVEGDSIQAAERGSRELGSHATTDPRISGQFKKQYDTKYEAGKGSAPGKEWMTKQTLQNGLVINEDLNVFDTFALWRYLDNHKDQYNFDKKDLDTLQDLWQRKSMRESSTRADALNMVANNFNTTVDNVKKNPAMMQQVTNMETAILAQLEDNFGNQTKHWLRSKGFDHIAYRNNGEYATAAGNYKRSEFLDPDAAEEVARLGSNEMPNELDVSLIILNDSDWFDHFGNQFKAGDPKMRSPLRAPGE